MDVQARLERLESQNRRLQAAMYVVGLCLATAVTLGAGAGAQTSDNTSTHVDKKDMAVRSPIKEAAFGKAGAGPTPDLLFMDKNGVVVMRLGIEPDGSPIIAMRNASGTRQFAIWPDQANAYNIENQHVTDSTSVQALYTWCDSPDRKLSTIMLPGLLQLNNYSNDRESSINPGFTLQRKGDNHLIAGVTDQDAAIVELKDANGMKAITTH
jgi:hypothetical protein